MSDTPRAWKGISSLLGLFFLAASTAGCTATTYADKTDEIAEVPGEEVSLEGLGTDRWCSDFGQRGLDEIVAQAWSDNLRLKAAWARLEQAQAVAEIADASLWPVVEGNAGADYSSSEFDQGADFGGNGGGGSGAEASWELSAAASYEVDIWGRFRHRATAAELEAEAVEADARALAITLTSQVAEAWFDVIAFRERVELLQEQLETSKNMLEIIRQKLRRGLASAIDAAQQEQNVESIIGELADAKAQLSTARHRLSVLIGRPPGDDEGETLVEAEELPEIDPIPEAGVPADLLERRPDIRAAYLLLRAADERTAAAVADRLPRLQLSASLGFQSTQIANLFGQLFWGVGAGLSQPIFEGGRLRAEVERSEAVAQEQLYEYANTLLVAIQEVRDALVLETRQGERIDSLQRELRHARTVVDLARRRYRTGTVDYLQVLTGLRGLQEVERALIEARRQHISNRIALCRALGGSWVESVEPSINNDD